MNKFESEIILEEGWYDSGIADVVKLADLKAKSYFKFVRNTTDLFCITPDGCKFYEVGSEKYNSLGDKIWNLSGWSSREVYLYDVELLYTKRE